jgi:ATP synthase protein I
LTVEEHVRVNTQAMGGLLQVVLAQGTMAVAAVVVAWIVGGVTAAWSALAGAGAYFLPNALFALRLIVGLLGGSMASPITFFLGEMLKLALTVLLLWMLAHYAQQWLVWPAVLWGLILTLKGYFLLLMFRKLS